VITSLSAWLQKSGYERSAKLDFQDIVNWLQALAVQYGYFGVFLLSLIGAASIIFPVPYTVVLFTLAGVKNHGSWVFEPVWMAVVAGLGSTIGEFSGYLLGFGGRKALGERYKRKMQLVAQLFNKYGSIVIFVFSLTPLPDDLLFIPLGVMRYSIIRTFVPAVLGKFLMSLIVAYSGRFSVGFIGGIFGGQTTWASALIGMILASVILILVLVIMFKLDWEKYVEKYLVKDESTTVP
jgi:membrane protein YqaA with SNARE-associated domain